MNFVRLSAAILFAASVLPQARAAESFDNCVGFIDSLPATISTQGTWCLRKDLATAQTSGAAITIATNNVIIDCNNFKLGGLAAGPATNARGIAAFDRTNAVVRQCNIRGFRIGVLVIGSGASVEDNRLEGITDYGMWVQGSHNAVRRNVITATGGRSPAAHGIHSVGTGDAASGADIVDNIIDGVTPAAGPEGVAVGIYAEEVGQVVIRGNRVRGLMGQASELGIYNNTSNYGSLSVIGNQLMGSGTATGIGIYCGQFTDGPRHASDNIVNGFETAMLNCTDGGNSL